MLEFKKIYKKIVVEFKEKFNVKNDLQVPKLKKIVVNIGVSEAVQNSKCLDSIESYISLITTQKPAITRAKKSIAGFKLREGMPIGMKVTLRNYRMYNFLDKLANISLPRMKDFKGLSTRSFDSRGNYTLGLREQLIFPEIVYDNIDKIRGMSINFFTSASDKEGALFLLKRLGLPFKTE